ncbi:MAG: tRNA lysidine(34) synthetase TilS [Nocardioides sp.]|uniref:tRNA lysidine(34) synthetase TilS n=1 Tax=Nocardioides sp. TaxID=35761 RepID=UPI0039E3E8CF
MALHPTVAAVRREVRRSLADLDPGAVVLVACSGGADSLALVAATVAERADSAWRVVGVTVDHGLQEGSTAQAARVVDQMAALGVDETVTATVRVEAGGLGVEAAARQARYAVLEELAQRFEADAVLLGHTRDDQAETVLLGLTRGSGGRALAGMRRGFGPFRRPLLEVSRTDTETACAVQGIEAWQDPHNDDPRFTRSRVRHTVLPMLEDELGPGVTEALARTADQLRVDMDHLDDLADLALADLALAALTDPAPIAELAVLPTAVRRRVLRLLALRAGAPAADLFHTHVLAVDALVVDWRGQRWIDLPGHLRAVRRDGMLHVERSGPAAADADQ